MFQQRRQATAGNIKLGTLGDLPTVEDLQFLLEQATKYRGRFAEVAWSVPKTGASFQLTAKITAGQPLPSWMLYGGATGNSLLLWGHNSNDLTLIHNLVMLECDKPVDGSNSISANSIDNMMSQNASAGAAAATTSQVPAGAPGAQWLQNLNYGQQGGTEAQAPNAVAQTGTSVQALEQPLEQVIQSPGDLLDGSLTNISVANLFRYINNNRLSGRLAVQSSFGAGEVFFVHGDIKHAATLDSKGDNALYEMCTWLEGEFQFYAEELTRQQSVEMPSADLISGCRKMVELFSALIHSGLTPAAYLVRTGELPRQDFERIVQKGAPQVDVYTQFRLFEQTTGNRTFEEILRACPLLRAEWIPAVHNLIQTGLLQVSDRPAIARPGAYLEGQPINDAAINNFLSSVTEPDGLLSSGAFLYLLQQEYFRHERTGSTFSLALFSMAQMNPLDGNVTRIDRPGFIEAIRRIMEAKRKLDVVGYFDDNNCAILLPETDAAGACVFANRVIALMKKTALSPALEGAQLLHAFGIAAVPDDARELDTLIAAVRVAMNKARMMGAPIIVYSDAG
jgi:GGDEF domain-containing protein